MAGLRIVLSMPRRAAGNEVCPAAVALANEMVVRSHDVMIQSDQPQSSLRAFGLSPAVHHLRISLGGRLRIKRFNPDLAFLFCGDSELPWQYATFHGLGFGIGAQECVEPTTAAIELANNPRIGDVYAGFATREAFLAGMHAIRLTHSSEEEMLPAIARASAIVIPDYAGAATIRSADIFDRWETLFRKIGSYKGAPERLLDDQRKIDASQAEHLTAIRERCIENARKSRGRITAVTKATRSAPLVSFVVPLFNKEKFIEETVRSILKCDYPQKEIIIVDDCSTDHSSAIMERTAAKNSQVRLLKHARNRGLSAARNTGLAHATGKYIQFWDADDVYSRSALTSIISDMEEDRSQIGTGIALRDGQVPGRYRDAAVLRRRVNFELAPEAFSTNSSCFKIYDLDFFRRHQLRFVEGLYIQDAELNLRAFPRAERITVTPHVMGEYRSTADSASKICSARRIESCFEIERLTRDDYEANGYSRFERFRQAKLITFVHAFFIGRLLRLEAGVFQEGVFTQEMHSPGLVDSFLERFAGLLRTYRLGIPVVAKRQPRVALGCIALIQGERVCANLLFSRLSPGPADLEKLEAAARAFGVERSLRKIQAPPPPSSGARRQLRAAEPGFASGWSLHRIP
jgi:CDP-glycerol glycerophosphotransferase